MLNNQFSLMIILISRLLEAGGSVINFRQEIITDFETYLAVPRLCGTKYDIDLLILFQFSLTT